MARPGYRNINIEVPEKWIKKLDEWRKKQEYPLTTTSIVRKAIDQLIEKK